MIDVRSRRSKSLNRARAELELRRSVRPLIVIVLGGIVGLLIAGYIASKVAPNYFSSSRTVKFAVDDATAVIPGNQELRFKGIPIGVVKDVELVDGSPVITAEYKASYGRIYRNARVELRPSTPLMDMYVDVVDRGTSEAGVLGNKEPLPAGQTDAAVNSDDVLNVFRSDVRTRLALLLDNLGNGLDDRGARLREAVAQLTPLLDVAGRITHQLAVRERATRQLVHNSASLTTALAERDGDLRAMVENAGAALSALRDGAPDLAATIDVLPSTMARLNTSFAALRGVLDDVDGAVNALRPVARQVPSALSALRGINRDAGPAVAALERPVHELVPFSRSLVPLSDDLEPSVKRVLPHVPVLDRATKTVSSCKKGLGGFFHWSASLGKFGDARGPGLRGQLQTSAQALSIPSPGEAALPQCAPGAPIGGRLPTEEDLH